MEDPYNLILILWWRWMESTSCSLPRQHWFGEGYHSFLHFPQSILGKIFNSKKFLKVTNTLFEGHSTRIYMGSNLFRPLWRPHALCQDYIGVVKVNTPLGHFLHLPQPIVDEFEKIIFQHPNPISRSLDSNLHEFEFVSTSIAHIFMLFVGLFLPLWPFCMCAHYACSRGCWVRKNYFPTPTPYFEVAQLEFVWVRICYDLYCTHFYAFCWPIFAFLAILHVCTLCVYPQVTQQVV